MSDASTISQRHGRWRPNARTLRVAAVAAVLVIGSGSVAYAYASTPLAPAATDSSPPACAPASEQPPPSAPPAPTPTTITTVQQVYECIFAHHFSGPVLDARTLLTGAFIRFTAELQRRGVDQPTATLPALTGNRGRDWTAFAEMYQKVLAGLPEDATLRQTLAAETIRGMIDQLHDNHNGFGQAVPPDVLGLQYTFEGRPNYDAPSRDIRDSTGPMYVTKLVPGSPAAAAGLKPGDVIEAVNDVPVFVSGQLTAGVIDLLHPRPGQSTVKIAVRRPATDTRWAVELRPTAIPRPPSSAPTVKLLSDGIAYVEYLAFDAAAADEVLQRIAALRATTTLRGIILDLRGNGGGGPEAVAKLLGAFARNKVWSWACDVKDRCTPNRTDNSVAQLNLPLVVLTDGRCASACDAFSAAVRDLKLGKLVGARTAGIVSGLPSSYRLNDNTLLALTATHHVGPNREIINGIGVAVDHQAPMTARDLSTGRDPAVEKAILLLTA